MNRYSISMIFSLIFTLNIFSYDNIPLMIPKEKNEPNDIFPQKLLDAEYNYTIEKGQYADDCYQRVVTFFSSLECTYSETVASQFEGTWMLFDDNKNAILGQKYRVHFFKTTYDGERLDYRDLMPPSTHIYYSQSNIVYFLQPWGFGSIMQARIYNSKLYLYILKGDYWILDERHMNGRHYYQKFKLDVPDYP